MQKPASIQENVPLAQLTTLGVGGSAAYFAIVRTTDELAELALWAESEAHHITVIGGGSNILVSDNGLGGLVLQIAIDGEVYEDRGDAVHITVGAGVVFDTLVEHTIREGLWGLENLSAIPGTVGGVPIQNVGAYGVEARGVIESVKVFDRETNSITLLTNEQCQFAYRDSLFKHAGRERYIVTAVTFTLSKTPRPHLSYRDLAARFGDNANPSLPLIREAVCEIRAGKFPDWHVVGTAGSFFKNPIVDSETHARILSMYSAIPTYPEADGRFKIALGWILDRVLSLKGYREGNVGLYSEQALVLVNYGGATADDISAFSERIIEKIFNATGIRIEREVVVMQK
jgi:UDP-N-acetylmuramate dehydrogenase